MFSRKQTLSDVRTIPSTMLILGILSWECDAERELILPQRSSEPNRTLNS